MNLATRLFWCDCPLFCSL